MRGASLQVEPGEFVALIGRSGSGKSTLLQLLAGLDEPTAGSLTIAGTSLNGLTAEARAAVRLHQVGVVFQRDNLWNQLTALGNVELVARLGGQGEPRQRAQHLLDELGLGRRAAHHPAALSGGEQQRVAIAVALANDPALILADEPTGELDRGSEQLVLDQLDLARRLHGSALLVVTHNEWVAARASRVVLMEDGRCH